MMQVGDKVKFLDEDNSGVVSAIISHDKVMVQDKHGFESPAFKKALIVTESTAPVISEEQAEEEGQQQSELLKFCSHKDDLFLLFYLHDRASKFSSKVTLFLINNFDSCLYFTLSTRERHIMQLVYAGEMEAYSSLQLLTVDTANIDKLAKVACQGVLFNATHFEQLPPLNGEFESREKDLVNRINFETVGDSMYYVVPLLRGGKKKITIVIDDTVLTSDEIQGMLDSSTGAGKSPAARPATFHGIYEKDLHIENLVHDHSRMTNSEILDIQIGHMHGAIAHGLQGQHLSVVLIHGVGQGILRAEIHKVLRNEYPRYKFIDASPQGYGKGATEVFLH